MGVLWCGGEDLDFYNTGGGPLPSVVSAGSTQFRTAYSRCGLYCSGSNLTSCRSASFSGGAITSCWLHFQCAVNTVGTSNLFCGLGLNSAAQIALAVGQSSTSGSKLGLWKFSAGSWSSVATESGNSMSSAVTQFDIHVQTWGGTVTVDVYLNGAGSATLSFTGTIAVTGVSTLDCVAIPGNGGTTAFFISEIIVTDSVDTRTYSLAALKPNAAGTTNNWDAGDFSNINPISINDASVATVNSTAKDLEAAVSALTSGSFSVPAVRVCARAQVTSGATPTGLKLGVKTPGGNNVGSANTLTQAWQTFDRIMATNPVSAAAWVQSDITTPIQIDLQSS